MFPSCHSILMIQTNDLVNYCNQLLNIKDYQDYGPNGLHIQGKKDISKIAFAVSATFESVKKAVELKADALIVHHGLFWKFHGPKTITNAFYNRVAPLIKNDINLLGYHLPLDGHIELGNAASLAHLLNTENIEPFGFYKGAYTGVKAIFKNKITAKDLKTQLEKVLNHSVILSSYDDTAIVKSIGIITGGANSDWVKAKKENLDAYLTGEISEHDWHEAKESGIHFFAGGHNATEQFGIQSLMKHLHDQYQDKDLEFYFIPSENPA